MRHVTLAMAFAFLALAWPASAQLSELKMQPPAVSAESYILMDFLSGEVIAGKDADLPLPPASLTKIMTAYLAFSALKEGRLTERQPVLISEKAWRMAGSRTFIEVGDQILVRELILGMIVQSGNDASVALAEAIAGTEERFADLMNQQAKLLGMKNTHFVNATGLPSENHVSTARDMAILTRRTVQDFPEYYKLYSVRQHTFNNITQRNRNGLLDSYAGADGLKTGYTREARYCLVASAVRDGMRLISVVMKTPSVRVRERDTSALLNFGFVNYRSVQLFEDTPELKKVRVWGGNEDLVAAGINEAPIVLLLPRNNKKLSAEVSTGQPLEAPLEENEEIGEVTVYLGDEELFRRKLVTLGSIQQGGWLKRVSDYIKLNYLGGS